MDVNGLLSSLAKKQQKDKYPCLTCASPDACSRLYFCRKICTIPVIRMTERELDELARRTRIIQIY